MKEEEVSPEGDKRSRLSYNLEIEEQEDFKKRIWSRASLPGEHKTSKQ